jgi:hypothetical protein
MTATNLSTPSVQYRIRANIEEFPFVYIPYSLRQYQEPGSREGFWDISGYEEESHEQNLSLLGRVLEVHGGDADRTPWLTSGIGILAVKHTRDRFDYRSVYLADDRMSYRQGLHYVRQEISVHTKKGLKARTKIYPTISKLIANFTSSDAAWAMSYPVFRRNPEAASEHLEEWLTAPHELGVVTKDKLEDIFPLRHFALRHWVHVKLDS